MEYLLRDIPEELWKKAKRRSQDYGIPLRTLLLRGLRDQLDLMPARSLPRISSKTIRRCFADWNDFHVWAKTYETSAPIVYALAIYAGNKEDMHWMWKNPGNASDIIELAREIAPKFDGYDEETPLYWGKEWGRVA